MIRPGLAALTAVSVLALAACKPQTPAPAAETAAAGLAACESLTEEAFDDFSRADCRMALPDETGRTVEFRFAALVDYQTPATIILIDADGTSPQEISTVIDGGYGMPQVIDIDGDGRADLLVPLYTGNVNTNYTLWRSVEATPPFVLAGEIGGIDFGPVGDGLFASTARGSATTWYTSYYTFADNQLSPVATAETELSENGPATCKVEDDGGLDALGLTLDDARLRFCANDQLPD